METRWLQDVIPMNEVKRNPKDDSHLCVSHQGFLVALSQSSRASRNDMEEMAGILNVLGHKIVFRFFAHAGGFKGTRICYKGVRQDAPTRS